MIITLYCNKNTEHDSNASMLALSNGFKMAVVSVKRSMGQCPVSKPNKSSPRPWAPSSTCTAMVNKYIHELKIEDKLSDRLTFMTQ